MQHPFLKIEVSVGFFSSGPPCACAIHVTHTRVFLLLSGFPSECLFPQCVMDPLSSSASTVPSIDDYFEHDMWNPLLELLFLEQADGFVASYLVEIDVAKIALSCHFAFDSPCYKEEILAST